MIKRTFCILTFLLGLCIFCTAQNRSCDSSYFGDTIHKSKFVVDDSDLVLLYRTGHITIKVPMAELLKEAPSLGLTIQEIKKRAKAFRELNLENDMTEFWFCNQARKVAFNMLYKNKCLIKIDSEVIREYKELAFRSTNCLNYSRFVFEHEYYYAIEDIRLID